MATKYRKLTTFRKAAQTGITFLLLFAAGVATVEIPEDSDAFDKAMPALLIAVIGAAWRAYNNMSKNRDKVGNPLGGPTWPSGYLFLICAALALSGCATTLPAVGGKTHYDVEFSDVTAEQNTGYKMSIKAPAGVELASITGMTYDWQPDGSGAINVSQSGNVDSTAQAALIAEVVCGGDVDAGTLVSEEYLMTLERKAFCALIVHPKTQERILGMLSTGKPVRN